MTYNFVEIDLITDVLEETQGLNINQVAQKLIDAGITPHQDSISIKELNEIHNKLQIKYEELLVKYEGANVDINRLKSVNRGAWERAAASERSAKIERDVALERLYNAEDAAKHLRLENQRLQEEFNNLETEYYQVAVNRVQTTTPMNTDVHVDYAVQFTNGEIGCEQDTIDAVTNYIRNNPDVVMMNNGVDCIVKRTLYTNATEWEKISTPIEMME